MARPSGLRSGYALSAPGRTRPTPAGSLRCPENTATLRFEGTWAVPGPQRRCPEAGKSRLQAISAAGVHPSGGKWPVLHFGVAVGNKNNVLSLTLNGCLPKSICIAPYIHVRYVSWQPYVAP